MPKCRACGKAAIVTPCFDCGTMYCDKCLQSHDCDIKSEFLL